LREKIRYESISEKRFQQFAFQKKPTIKVRNVGSTTVSVEKYFFFSSLALIVIFAWMEPAGAAGIGFWKGLLFWSIQIAILIPLLITVQHFTSQYVNTRTPKAPWVHTAFAGVVAALLFVPLAYFLDFLFAIPDDSATMDILPGLLDEASGVIVPVTVTWLALNAPWILQLDFSNRRAEAVAEKQDQQHAAPPSSEKEQSGRFLQELRSRASGDLISISSELHYLRVVTTDTVVMFLYNLKDAIEELPVNSGVQVHRSHWVAREHIKQLTKKNGNSVCILSNGSSLPVSRRKYAEVKDLLVS
jgi:hypothetical protein